MQNSITVETMIDAPVARVWEAYTNPQHITHWNYASDDWSSPRAESDLRPGGKFNYRMEANDGSMGFDFTGTFTAIEPRRQLNYTLDDGRKCAVSFSEQDERTHVRIDFEAENTHSREMQATGWQAILENFKHYAESL